MGYLRILLCFLGLIVAIVVFLIYYLGVFQRILFKTGLKGDYKLVYGTFRGPYDQTHTVMNKIHGDLEKEFGKFGKTHRCFGCYFDNPKKVEKSKLRSIAGCIIKDDDLFERISKNDGFKTLVVPKGLSIFTYYKLPGLLFYVYLVALIIGIIRVYGKFDELYGKKIKAEDMTGGCFEIYDPKGVEFVIPLKLEKEFFNEVKMEFEEYKKGDL